MGQSVISGDYSGGSGSSKKKANNIDGQDITIQDFKKIQRNKSDLQNLSRTAIPIQYFHSTAWLHLHGAPTACKSKKTNEQNK